jgi:hypothetical protein
MPVLANPLNQIGFSDLVSKDLMDKFHNFLAHTYVTIGQVKGRTWLPLPPNDVTSSEKTSSKDKAHILEGKPSSLFALEGFVSLLLNTNSLRGAIDLNFPSQY